MVIKLNTNKSYYAEDKIKSPKARPVTYTISLITTNSYRTSLIYNIFEKNAIDQVPYFKINYISVA